MKMQIQQRQENVLFDYYAAREKLPKPDGVHCILCGKDLPKRRQKYCSDECFADWFRKVGVGRWDEIRNKALERDGYRCVKCGLLAMRYNGYPLTNGNFVVDHIRPIALGGEEFDLSNLQTLCVACNTEKTRKDLSDISRLREAIKDDERRSKAMKVLEENRLRWDGWKELSKQ